MISFYSIFSYLMLINWTWRDDFVSYFSIVEVIWLWTDDNDDDKNENEKYKRERISMQKIGR